MSRADVAHWWIEHAHVFPLQPGTKKPYANCRRCRAGACAAEPCPCLAAERPCHGMRAATRDPELIHRWWTAQPDANIGIATGPSHLLVVDLDAHTDAPAPAEIAPGIPALPGTRSGWEAWDAITAHYGAEWSTHTETLAVLTPSDGLHLYYRRPPEVHVTSSSGRAGWQVDIRAMGGYVVAPGSQTPAGEYVRVSAGLDIAPAPGWLARHLLATGHISQPRPVTPASRALPRRGGGQHPPAWWERAWAEEVARVATAGPHQRQATLPRAARRLVELTGEPGCPWSLAEVEEALLLQSVHTT